jgi:hypothetical protein
MKPRQTHLNYSRPAGWWRLFSWGRGRPARKRFIGAKRHNETPKMFVLSNRPRSLGWDQSKSLSRFAASLPDLHTLPVCGNYLIERSLLTL